MFFQMICKETFYGHWKLKRSKVRQKSVTFLHFCMSDISLITLISSDQKEFKIEKSVYFCIY